MNTTASMKESKQKTPQNDNYVPEDGLHDVLNKANKVSKKRDRNRMNNANET